MEEGKERHYRGFPQRLLQLLLLFLVLCFTFSIFSVYMIKHFGVQNVVTTIRPSLQSCSGEASNNLDRWIQPPDDLMHSMSDEELFWRASFAPRVDKYPFKSVPKIAFMFLTKGPLPLAPLWERFFKGHKGLYSIYIHSFPSYKADFPSSSVFYKRQIPSKESEWGKMSMCDAERRLLANALLDIHNEWFVLLSESCIPLVNFATTYNFNLNRNIASLGHLMTRAQMVEGAMNTTWCLRLTSPNGVKALNGLKSTENLLSTLLKTSNYTQNLLSSASHRVTWTNTISRLFWAFGLQIYWRIRV